MRGGDIEARRSPEVDCLASRTAACHGARRRGVDVEVKREPTFGAADRFPNAGAPLPQDFRGDWLGRVGRFLEDSAVVLAERAALSLAISCLQSSRSAFKLSSFSAVFAVTTLRRSGPAGPGPHGPRSGAQTSSAQSFFPTSSRRYSTLSPFWSQVSFRRPTEAKELTAQRRFSPTV